ncbi:hypothetical protein [Candidatus Albibeggiatoa sp. nov. NOAA]|uniref:hypothetical protein n=1 Tax=Candidatus Albibeggiatoa sp. nov. NOAA TaxID=3162724 RepID=UPI0032F8D469|nr:hypothetical protein [Thiotrichaceae bacterium]
MKLTQQTLISVCFFSFLLTLWFLNKDIIYDYAIFTIFGLYNLISWIVILINLIFRKKAQHYLVPAFYIICVQLILFDIELANQKAIDVVEQNKVAFEACCHHKNVCPQLNGKWIVHPLGSIRTTVQGVGANISITYLRYDTYYDVRPDYFLANSKHIKPIRLKCIRAKTQ